MASSPLAAMRQSSFVSSWAANGFGTDRGSVFLSGKGCLDSPRPLERAARERKLDYFNVKNVRGSSPAASLAADMSVNFRLDSEASPCLPTPRRALFSDGSDKKGPIGTPEILTSSPVDMSDMMDISPLPPKGPLCTQVEVTSPTPVATPADEEMMDDSPVPAPRQSSLEPPKMAIPDRRRAAPRRPSLTRMKGMSHCGLPMQPRAVTDSSVPQFRFGEARLGHRNSAVPLCQLFDSASPPQDRKNSAPAVGHQRRTSNPFLRTRKQVRRSLSMFEHPGDIMKPQKDAEQAASTALQSVTDVEEAHEPALPHFFADDPTDTIPRINKSTLLEVLDGRYSARFEQKMIIDCRFEYEYDGGHINGAVNYNDKELLASQLFRTPMHGRTLLVFHCEYSAHRAPLMARHVRSEDRTANADQYPKLTYPEVYILDGGYSAFFTEHRDRCHPQNYIEMSDARHQRTCEREMGRLKARKAIGRAQTFAFGQRDSGLDDSPTAPGRPSSRHAAAPSACQDRLPSRRMASH